MYENLFSDFYAFHVNALHSLIYIVRSNLALILTIAGAVIITLFNVKEEVETYVTEEQNII